MIPIQFIIQASNYESCADLAQHALQAGCKWIQLQTNDMNSNDADNAARQLLSLCHDHQATFILGSDIERCKAIKADGVFLTAHDTPANAIREVLGHEFIIGATAHTFEQIKLCKRMSADFVQLPLVGDVTNIATIKQQMAEAELRMPICATTTSTEATHIIALLDAGADGIALSSATLTPAQVEDTLQQLLHIDE